MKLGSRKVIILIVLVGLGIILWQRVDNFLIILLGLYLGAMAILAIVFVAALFVRKSIVKADMQVYAIMRILYEECDPQRTMQGIESLMRTNPKRNKRINEGREYHLSLGCFAGGEFDKAINILKKITLAVNNGGAGEQINSMVLAAHHNLGMCYLGKRDVASAASHLETLKSYSRFTGGKHSIGKKQMAQIDETLDALISDLEAFIALEEGRGWSVIDRFLSRLTKAENRYERVCANFYLADIYEQSRDTQKQKQHLEYVVKHGNSLYIARLARDKLRAVSKDSQN